MRAIHMHIRTNGDGKIDAAFTSRTGKEVRFENITRSTINRIQGLTARLDIMTQVSVWYNFVSVHVHPDWRH